MSKFMTELDVKLLDGDGTWEVSEPLVYYSSLLKYTISVPKGFQTDFASVPRVPIAYTLFGDKAHREAVLHDYLYRIDSIPTVERKQADDVFFEAMELRGKSFFVKWCMWSGVRLGGWTAYHKLKISAKLTGAKTD